MGAYIGANRWRQLLSGQEANSSVYMGGDAFDHARFGNFTPAPLIINNNKGL
jgi:hypothetical protein